MLELNSWTLERIIDMWGNPQSQCHVTGYVYTSVAMVTMFSCYTEVISYHLMITRSLFNELLQSI